MKLEFHVKFFTLLNFHQIEFFIETRFWKIEFQNKDILLHLLGERDKCPFWPIVWHFEFK